MAGRFSSIGLKDGTIRKEITEYNRAERLWDDTYETIEEIGEINLPTKSYHYVLKPGPITWYLENKFLYKWFF